MVIRPVKETFSICKLKDVSALQSLLKLADFTNAAVEADGAKCLFFAKTDSEVSLVCNSKSVPDSATEVSDGWRGFYFDGVLDFSLVGVLAEVSAMLADNGIPIFAVSTFNTDYVFVKEDKFATALAALTKGGYVLKE